MKLCKKDFSLFIFSLGLSAALLHILTLKRLFSHPDGPSLYGYGFPSPWLKFSQVSSLHYEIHLTNLALNFLVYFLLTFFLSQVFLKLTFIKEKLKMGLNVLGAVMIISSLLFIKAQGKYYQFNGDFFGNEWSLEEKKIHFGLSRPYGP